MNAKVFNITTYILLGFVTISQFIQAQTTQYFTISGYVRNKETGENILGANIFSIINKTGTTTNEYGFYSIRLPKGKVSLQYSYVGYDTQNKTIELSSNIKLNIELNASKELDEVIVYGKRSNTGINATQMGAMDIPIDLFKKVPAVLGEADAIKTIQLMPGIQASTEGSSGISTRGGGPDENLILLDGVSLYNVDHLFGFFSIFTPEAIKKISVYKSSFPARYSGRTSSVIDVRINDGDMHKYHGTIGIGLLSAKIQVEGPITKDRTAFNIAARRSYIDLAARPFMDKEDKFSYYFYDFNAKINHRFSDKHRLYFGFYNGTDNFDYEHKDDLNNYQSNNDNKLKWGNTTASLRWNYVISPNLFCNTTIAYSKYKYQSTVESSQSNNSYNSNTQSGINDITYTVDFDYHPSPKHYFKFGINQQGHSFKPEMVTGKISDNSYNTEYSNQSNSTVRSYESNLYIEDNCELTNRISTNVGINFSAYHVRKKTYSSLQPRISIRYQLTDNLSFKGSFTQMKQNIHLLSSYAMNMPTDLWVPATDNIKPMQSNQYSIGAYYTGINKWQFSIEGYYKRTGNVLEYKDGASLMGASVAWEEKVDMGKGRTMGLELMAQKTIGNTTGWLSYTLAKSERKFSVGGINDGNWFPYKYDRRHNFNIALNHQFSKKIDFSATWELHTGGATTIAGQNTIVVRLDENTSSPIVGYVGERNNCRLPNSHHLSLGINFNKVTKHGMRTWNISIYNVYNAMNPTFIFRESKDENGNHQNVLKKTTILPLIPSLSYTYKF